MPAQTGQVDRRIGGLEMAEYKGIRAYEVDRRIGGLERSLLVFNDREKLTAA